MGSLTELLLATQDPSRCKQAQDQIFAAEKASVDQYFTALAQELAGSDKPAVARQLSGLLLKNGLFAKDAAKNAELKNRWFSLPDTCRNLVKEATTQALIAPEVDVGKAAAQVLAKIGTIEIPQGTWPGLVPLLLQHVTNQDPNNPRQHNCRQIALVTLGYLCEDLVLLQEQEGVSINDELSNHIMTAVVQGMRDVDASTKLEATRAFYHAVGLASRAFKNERERSFIMEVVLETCKFEGSELVQIAAFECLVQIAAQYYQYTDTYIEKFWMLLLHTVRTSPEKVAIPAMEFWSTICDEELYIEDLVAYGQAEGRRSLNIIQQVLPFLVPLLTETLTRQQDEEDDDTWNLAMAAGTCLGLVAQVVGDGCVDLVLAFVQQNFGNPDWKHREAAMLAYGSIMEGPTSEKMRPLVQSSYGSLVGLLNDQSVAVRDTIAWTLGRIAQFHPSIVPVQSLMPALVEKLRDVPRVASNTCWVVQVIAEAQTANATPGQAPMTTALSQFFPMLAEGLLAVAARPDAQERNLRMAAYNALSVLVTHSGNDCLGHMEKLMQEMLNHLANSFKCLDRECELQGYICGVLTALTQRLREKLLPAADRLMEECLKVFQAYQQVKGGAQVLQEEALLLAAAIANAVGANFERFMPHFAPYLKVGLENYEDTQVCVMATGVVGDLCRALEGKVITYCDVILQILYANLQNTVVDRRIKAAIMAAFGDIALAVTGDFEKYLAPVMVMLKEASATKKEHGPADNEDWIEYLNSLREGVLEAYTGIIHGLRDANKLHLFKEHVNTVIFLVKEITEDPSHSDSVMRAAVGVIGDLIMVFQQELTAHLGQAPFLVQLVEYASRCQDDRMQKTAQWLRGLLQKYAGGIQN
eukprot:TRINITY_DN9102_c0_g1_i3.p1 TRINITY_DN9102_c0_g1~~TRINITY_DN9102_c0_g1_i3.p1  ORF type:complete len:869 (+),score=201.79 TRINITY_DN9102_c0_g1_i3:154-2760(+)